MLNEYFWKKIKNIIAKFSAYDHVIIYILNVEKQWLNQRKTLKCHENLNVVKTSVKCHINQAIHIRRESISLWGFTVL